MSELCYSGQFPAPATVLVKLSTEVKQWLGINQSNPFVLIKLASDNKPSMLDMLLKYLYSTIKYK